MSEYNIRNVEGVNVVLGDHATVNARNSSGKWRTGDAATASLDELADQVSACTDDIRAMERTIAELREELGRPHRRGGRIRSLLDALGTSAQTVATVAAGVEKVRESIGHLS